MRKGIPIVIILIVIMTSLLCVGCSKLSVKYNDINTYEYTKDNRFEISSQEEIDDGTTNGLTIRVLVDKETGVMYLYTEKFKSGYGTSLTVLVDKDGKPLIYEGNK